MNKTFKIKTLPNTTFQLMMAQGEKKKHKPFITKKDFIILLYNTQILSLAFSCSIAFWKLPCLILKVSLPFNVFERSAFLYKHVCFSFSLQVHSTVSYCWLFLFFFISWSIIDAIAEWFHPEMLHVVLLFDWLLISYMSSKHSLFFYGLILQDSWFVSVIMLLVVIYYAHTCLEPTCLILY